jgi:hypothetical protein
LGSLFGAKKVKNIPDERTFFKGKSTPRELSGRQKIDQEGLK